MMQVSNQARDDLRELTRVVSIITGANSTAVFLPTGLLGQQMTTTSRRISTNRPPVDRDPRPSSIDLVAVTSASKLVKDCRIPVGHGLLGWVAEHGRPIHLAPCDGSGSALALYVDQEPIKSLVAVPIAFQQSLTSGHTHTLSTLQSKLSAGSNGVLMCDSVNAEGFTNNQVKVLEHFAVIIQRLLSWAQRAEGDALVETTWELFKQKSAELGDAIGHESIAILRIRVNSLRNLEQIGGISLAVQLSEQFVRLAQQAIPPHFPSVRLPDGDVAIAVDDMMSSFFQQKLQTLANHLSTPERPFQIGIECYRARTTSSGQCNVDATLQQPPISIKSSNNIGGVRA